MNHNNSNMQKNKDSNMELNNDFTMQKNEEVNDEKVIHDLTPTENYMEKNINSDIMEKKQETVMSEACKKLKNSKERVDQENSDGEDQQNLNKKGKNKIEQNDDLIDNSTEQSFKDRNDTPYNQLKGSKSRNTKKDKKISDDQENKESKNSSSMSQNESDEDNDEEHEEDNEEESEEKDEEEQRKIDYSSKE